MGKKKTKQVFIHFNELIVIPGDKENSKNGKMGSEGRWEGSWCTLQRKLDGVVEYVCGELLAWKKVLVQSLQNKQKPFKKGKVKIENAAILYSSLSVLYMIHYFDVFC